ncbi:MAG: PH domain-containing protein [Longispora sp.]|nr:PH domain-containing protein [Longispora sp. (in: high G+C Gram-positive bacteria)]
MGTPVYEWRVRLVSFIGKSLGALVSVAAAIFVAKDRLEVGMALGVAILLAAMAARDLLLRVRLSAAPEGVTVTAGLMRRRIPWGQIERIRVDNRSRMGLRSELLEIDAGDELYLFSARELSASPTEVADELLRMRTGR